MDPARAGAAPLLEVARVQADRHRPRRNHASDAFGPYERSRCKGRVNLPAVYTRTKHTRTTDRRFTLPIVVSSQRTSVRTRPEIASYVVLPARVTRGFALERASICVSVFPPIYTYTPPVPGKEARTRTFGA